MRSSFCLTPGMFSDNTLTAALAYARAGLKVLAVHGIKNKKCDCGRPSCPSPGKHPIASFFPQGHRDATCDEKTLQAVWAAFPGANVAVVPEGEMVILDVDSAAGLEAVKRLLLPTTIAATSGRGDHFYLARASNAPLVKLPDVDYRSDGKGYVVAPPSMHRSGVRYKWLDRAKDLAVLPRSFHSARKIYVDFSRCSKSGEGKRNTTLTSLAGSLRARGLDVDQILPALLALNKAVCDPPLSTREVQKIAESIGRYEKNGPLFGDMHDVVAEEVQWLYAPYLPRAR